jgi:hypothetical protein
VNVTREQNHGDILSTHWFEWNARDHKKDIEEWLSAISKTENDKEISRLLEADNYPSWMRGAKIVHADRFCWIVAATTTPSV